MRNDVVSGGYVLDTLNAAFWSLLTTESADADTTGAVTGALAGTLYGASTLPARWLDVLHDVADIRALAIQLVGWDA
jgi:ADP-ribosylglycohydrolase